MMIRTLLAAVGLGAIALAGAAALYAGGWARSWERDWGWQTPPPPRLVVSFAGLDLASWEGQEILDRRIEAAVDRICARHGQPAINLRARALERECRRDAWASTQPQVAAAVEDAIRAREIELASMAPPPGYGPEPGYAPAVEPAWEEPDPRPRPVVFAPRGEIVQALPQSYWRERARRRR